MQCTSPIEPSQVPTKTRPAPSLKIRRRPVRLLFMALAASPMLLFFFAPPSHAGDMGRSLDGELSFSTNISNLLYDSLLGDSVKQSNAEGTIAWTPVFWFFQLGPVITGSKTETSFPVTIKDHDFRQTQVDTMFGGGLTGKINLADIQTAELVPWVGGSYLQLRSESELTVQSTEQPELAFSKKAVQAFVQTSTSVGITQFMNRSLGITLSYARILLSGEDELTAEDEAQGKVAQKKQRDSSRVQLGISTFF